MKTILINVAEGGALAVSDTVLGRCGEHANTTLQIVLGDTALAACTSFRLWLGDRYTPRLTAVNGKLTYVVPEDALIPPCVRLQVCGYVIEDSIPVLAVRTKTTVFTVETSACSHILCPDAVEPFEVLSAECAQAVSGAVAAKEAAESAEAAAASAASDTAEAAGEATASAAEAAESAAAAAASATEAAASAEDASDSASTATEAATTAVSAKTTASAAALAASGSSETASAAASQAVSSASSAASSASTASSAAEQAEIYASAAESAYNGAEEQAGIAFTNAGNASLSAGQAAASATAAAGSAASADAALTNALSAAGEAEQAAQNAASAAETAVNNCRSEWEEKADPDGTYPDMTVGTASHIAYTLEETADFFHRRCHDGKHISEGTARILSLRGRTILWNQLVPDEGGDVSVPQGHKALVREVDDFYCYITDGSYSYMSRMDAGTCVHDLTAMFGAGKEPATVAEFKRITAGLTRRYNAGTLVSVHSASMYARQFNQWNEHWEQGVYNTSGAKATGDGIRCKEKIPVVNGLKYCITFPNWKQNVGLLQLTILFYDEHDTYIGTSDNITKSGDASDFTFTVPDKAYFIRFYTCAGYGNTYGNDICLNVSGDGAHDGEYRRSVSNAVSVSLHRYFPDGMKAIGNVYDEFTSDAAIQRIGSREYQEGDESDSTLLTDGTSTYYVLEEPVVTACIFSNYYYCGPYGTEHVSFDSTSADTVTPVMVIRYPLDFEDMVLSMPKNYLNKVSLTNLLSAISNRVGYRFSATWNETNQCYSFSSTRIS